MRRRYASKTATVLLSRWRSSRRFITSLQQSSYLRARIVHGNDSCFGCCHHSRNHWIISTLASAKFTASEWSDGIGSLEVGWAELRGNVQLILCWRSVVPNGVALAVRPRLG